MVRDERAPRTQRRGTVAPGTPREETPGSELERRVARIEFAEGALTRLRVPVAAAEAEVGREVLTDIDVLAIDVDHRLRVSRSSSECKSGRGQGGEPQVIIWLAGFRQLLGLDRVTVVRPSISSRGRALARQLDIGSLDETTIAHRERAQKWLPERFAHLDGPECLAAENRADTQLKGLPSVPTDVVQFLRYDSFFAPPPAILGGLEFLRESVEAQGALPEPAATVIASHALVALLLAAVQDAGSLDAFSARELRENLQQELALPDAGVTALLDRADELMQHVAKRVHRAYIDNGSESQSVVVPSLRDAILREVSYLDDYVDLVERLRVNPSVARDLLQTAELACFEVLLGGAAWRSPAFAHLFTAEHKGLLLVALRCLRQVAGTQVAGYLSGLQDLQVYSGAGMPDRYTASTETERVTREPAAKQTLSGLDELKAE